MGARAAAAGGGAWGGGGGAAAVAREPLAGGGTAALRCLRSAAAERALDAARRGGPGPLPPLGPRQPGTPRVERGRPLPPGASPSGLRATARPAPLGRRSPSLPLPRRSPQRPGKKLPRKLPQAAGRQHGRLGGGSGSGPPAAGLRPGGRGGRRQRPGRSWARRFPALRYLLERAGRARGPSGGCGGCGLCPARPRGVSAGGTAPGLASGALGSSFVPRVAFWCVLSQLWGVRSFGDGPGSLG